MVSTRDRITYAAEFEVLDKALDDEIGIRLKFPTEGDAKHQRLRLHSARRADRDANREIYEPGEEMYGKSVYDPLVVRLKEVGKTFYLYVVRSITGEVESLSTLVPEPEPEPEPAIQRSRRV